MKNNNGNYMLYCGDKKYEVTPETQKTLEGIMYWSHCENLDSTELRAAEQQKRDSEREGHKPAYTDAEIAELQYAVKGEKESVRDFMKKMDEQHIPNWVGNGAMEWARNNDLREHCFKEFFEKSVYAKKQNVFDKPAPKYTKDIDEPLNFIECVQLIDTLIENDILHRDPNNFNNVLTYRTGLDKEKYGVTEGWCSENILDVTASELMIDIEGQKYLRGELQKKGVELHFREYWRKNSTQKSIERE